MLRDEEEVALNLGIERVGKFGAAHIVRSWLLPFSADLARVADLWNKLQGLLRDSHFVQEAMHHVLTGMPPTNMELPKTESDG